MIEVKTSWNSYSDMFNDIINVVENLPSYALRLKTASESIKTLIELANKAELDSWKKSMESQINPVEKQDSKPATAEQKETLVDALNAGVESKPWKVNPDTGEIHMDKSQN